MLGVLKLAGSVGGQPEWHLHRHNLGSVASVMTQTYEVGGILGSYVFCRFVGGFWCFFWWGGEGGGWERGKGLSKAPQRPQGWWAENDSCVELTVLGSCVELPAHNARPECPRCLFSFGSH